jgi:hypothetical protein
MPLRSRVHVALLSIPLTVLACSSAAPAPEASRSGRSAVDDADDAAAPVGESCYALFHWLQKDAYANTGGRSDPLWPPHTTTLIDVHCVGADGTDAVVASGFRDNHGSDPGSVDANGNPMLVEVKVSDPAPGSRATLLALLDSYSQCECAPATTFLSTAVLQDAPVQAVINDGLAYAEAHLQCDAPVTSEQLVALIRASDYDDAATALAGCTWDDTDAAGDALRALNAKLAQYHVCNNDAQLEAQQFATFASTGAVTPCDDTQPICQTPAWYYAP